MEFSLSNYIIYLSNFCVTCTFIDFEWIFFLFPCNKREKWTVFSHFHSHCIHSSFGLKIPHSQSNQVLKQTSVWSIYQTLTINILSKVIDRSLLNKTNNWPPGHTSNIWSRDLVPVYFYVRNLRARPKIWKFSNQFHFHFDSLEKLNDFPII